MFSLSVYLADAVLNAILLELEAGLGAAQIKIYSGIVPASARVGLSSNLMLCAIDCATPAAEVLNGVMTFGEFAEGTAQLTGTATFFRLHDSDGRTLAQGLVSDPNGSGELKLGTLDIEADAIVTVSSLSISV